MTRHDFDDPHAYHRRWERLAPDAAGSVAVHARARGGAPMMTLIADGPADGLGVVCHRRGRTHLGDLDRRWQQALGDVCQFYDIEPVGVLARTESGAIVRPPQTEPR